jgi:hypothetical protein
MLGILQPRMITDMVVTQCSLWILGYILSGSFYTRVGESWVDFWEEGPSSLEATGTSVKGYSFRSHSKNTQNTLSTTKLEIRAK